MNGLDANEFAKLFPDYNPDNNYKDYSIELEYGFEFHDTLQKIAPFDYKKETYRIFEPKDIHLLPIKSRDAIFLACKERYKDSFPIGANDKLSGGNHFHLTIPKESRADIYKCFRFKYIGQSLWNLMQNIPLYAKIYNGKYFSRPFFQSNSEKINAEIGNCGKGKFVVVKSAYLTTGSSSGNYRSIEFRWNNAIDTRLYGYYLGCLRAAVFQDFQLSVDKENADMNWDGNASLSTHENRSTINETSLHYLFLKGKGKMIREYHKENTKAFIFYLNQFYPIAAKNLYDYLQERDFGIEIAPTYWNQEDSSNTITNSLLVCGGDMPSVETNRVVTSSSSSVSEPNRNMLTLNPLVRRIPEPSEIDIIPF